MILTIILSAAATAGTYEYLYDLLPRIPMWATLPLIVLIALGVAHLPLMWLTALAVASAAGFVHGLVRRSGPPLVIQNRRSGLPPLP